MKAAVLLLLVLSALAGCRSATIRSESQSGYDFGPLRTYQWVSPEKVGATGMSEQDRSFARGISKVVVEEFTKRGYVRTDRDPDFLVLVAATTRTARRKGGGRRPARSRHTVGGGQMRYEEGLIVLRAWDRKTQALIWDCWARDAIRESQPPTAESITRIVTDMMGRFPAEVPAAKPD